MIILNIMYYPLECDTYLVTKICIHIIISKITYYQFKYSTYLVTTIFIHILILKNIMLNIKKNVIKNSIHTMFLKIIDYYSELII